MQLFAGSRSRPAFSHQRLSLTPSGKVCYRLPKPYYTGQTEVELNGSITSRKRSTSTRRSAFDSGSWVVALDGIGRPSCIENLTPSSRTSTAVDDGTLVHERLQRVLALVEATYSNSMIEAFWRSLKHQWIFLNPLDTLAHVKTLVAFFVEAHNTQMPHSAFRGQTPDEMSLGSAANLSDELAAARKKARERRLALNRAASCHRCAPTPGAPAGGENPP